MVKQTDIRRVRDFRDPNPPRRPRKPHKRDYPRYNRGKERKKRHFPALLAHLCSLIGQPEQTNGRPLAQLSDIIFLSVLKSQKKDPGRDFQTEIELAYRDGLIQSTLRWPTVGKYLADPKMTPLFKALVTISALPCRQVETKYAIDASGMSTSMYESWQKEKYGKGKKRKRQWVKVHVMVGTRTQSIVCADVTPGTVSDTKRLPDLVNRAAPIFTLDEIAADKGYISRFNLGLIDRLGAIPVIPFKSNHIVPIRATRSAWNRMIRWYVYEQEDFDSHYGMRNLSETAFSITKVTRGPKLLAKTYNGQVNETYCRLIVQNLTRLIDVFYQLGDVIAIEDFGLNEPIYPSPRLPQQIAEHMADDDATHSRLCVCPVCQHRSDPFWTLPGQTVPPVSTYTNGTYVNGNGNRHTDDEYPDNVISLFGRD